MDPLWLRPRQDLITREDLGSLTLSTRLVQEHGPAWDALSFQSSQSPLFDRDVFRLTPYSFWVELLMRGGVCLLGNLYFCFILTQRAVGTYIAASLSKKSRVSGLNAVGGLMLAARDCLSELFMPPDEVGFELSTEWPGEASAESTLPPRLRLLCIGSEEPSWVNLTLQLDAEGCLEPQFRWVSNSSEALSILRHESFDCLLLGEKAAKSKEDESCESSLSLLRAIRSTGCPDPAVMVTSAGDDEQWIEACRENCELLVSSNLWESLALVPMIKRAISRVEISRENHRLETSNHRRLVRERDEAEQLLRQQRQIIEELEVLAEGPEAAGEESSSVSEENTSSSMNEKVAEARLEIPERINDYYHELLRTYVIMGSGNLGGEIARLAELLSVAGLSPREALELHLERVESLVHGLGNRSARHVMARADLLALELVIHLGEYYQRRFQEAGMGVEGPSEL